MPATYSAIATTTLSSAAATITFNSIPSTYTDLRLVLVGTMDSSGSAIITFNNDSTALYSLTNMNGNGTAASSGRATGQTRIFYPYNGNFYNTTPAMLTLDLFSYTAAVNKTCLLTASLDNNGSGRVETGVGLYRSTSTINRIDLVTQSGNWNTGTTATIYGIKNA